MHDMVGSRSVDRKQKKIQILALQTLLIDDPTIKQKKHQSIVSSAEFCVLHVVVGGWAIYPILKT